MDCEGASAGQVDVGLTEFSAGLTTRCCTGARKPPRASSAVSFLPSFTISSDLEAMQRSSNLQTIWKENINGKNINAINIIVYYSHLRHIKISKNPKSHVALVEGGTPLFFSERRGFRKLSLDFRPDRW